MTFNIIFEKAEIFSHSLISTRITTTLLTHNVCILVRIGFNQALKLKKLTHCYLCEISKINHSPHQRLNAPPIFLSSKYPIIQIPIIPISARIIGYRTVGFIQLPPTDQAVKLQD